MQGPLSAFLIDLFLTLFPNKENCHQFILFCESDMLLFATLIGDYNTYKLVASRAKWGEQKF